MPPTATSHDDTGGTVNVSASIATKATARTARDGDLRMAASEAGARTSSRTPAHALTTISNCCACCDPIQPTRRKLALSAPAIAPTVFDAYTPPTSDAGSCAGLSAAAAPRANGKLRPHSTPGAAHPI